MLLGLAPLVVLAVVFELLSTPLIHYGYLSLALPTYLYAVFHHSGSPVGAIAVGLVVAIVPLLIRLVMPPASIETRIAYLGINALRVAAVGGVSVAVKVVLLESLGSDTLALLVGALAGIGVWLAIDQLLVNPITSAVEEPADVHSWQNVLSQNRFLLPLPVVLALLGAGFSFTALAGVIGIGLASLLGLAIKGALRYSIDEVVVKDQQALETKLKSAEYQSKMAQQTIDRLSQEAEVKGKELESVYQMASNLGASTKLEETMQVIHSMIRRLRIPYQSCVILLNRDGQLSPALAETPYRELLAMSHLLKLEEDLIQEVVEQQKPKLVSDMSSSSEGRIFKDEKSVLCVPLSLGSESVGVIYVGSIRAGTHKEEHLATLKMLAAFAAPSVKTAMLFEEKEDEVDRERKIREAVEAKNRQLAGLQKMGQQMGETLNPAKTMKVVANSLKQMIPDSQSVIMFTQDRKDKHAMKAEFSLTPYAHFVKNLALRDDEGLLGTAKKNRSTVLIQDTQHYEIQNLLEGERSVVVAPLLAPTESGKKEDEVLGCLYVGASRENAFTEEHRNLIETVSYQTAMALKNARLYEQTQQMALTDGLTGLYTHRLFQEKLSDEIEWSERHNRPFCLVMVDTDNFKTYNDTLGHPQGDALLKEIAALLKDKVRSTDIVCRYGGDEFALLLRETLKDDALKMCERIREAFQLRFGGNKVVVTASIGMACFPTDAVTKKDLAKAADDALYVSKRGGRNRVTASPPLEEREDIVQEILPR